MSGYGSFFRARSPSQQAPVVNADNNYGQGNPGTHQGAGSIPFAAQGSHPGAGAFEGHTIFQRSVGAKSGLLTQTRVTMFELIFLPWLLLAVVLACYLIAGSQGEVNVLWAVPIVLVILCVFFTRWHARARNTGDVALGVLCIIAIVISTGVGVYAEVANLAEYARLNNGYSYFNVLPNEPALGKNDATVVEFLNNTFVSTTQSFGHIDTSSELLKHYCVAPILSSDMNITGGSGQNTAGNAQSTSGGSSSNSTGTSGNSSNTSQSSTSGSNQIQYFAAGIDCCGLTGGFNCFPPPSGAHGGIVLPTAMHNHASYQAAIAGLEATYGVQAAPGAILLHWVSNPGNYKQRYWNNTWALFCIFAAVYAVISAMMGIMLTPLLTGSPSAFTGGGV